jgi:hypothetical protein
MINKSPTTTTATNAAIARPQVISLLRYPRLVLDNTVCAAQKATVVAGAILQLWMRIVT